MCELTPTHINVYNVCKMTSKRLRTDWRRLRNDRWRNDSFAKRPTFNFIYNFRVHTSSCLFVSDRLRLATTCWSLNLGNMLLFCLGFHFSFLLRRGNNEIIRIFSIQVEKKVSWRFICLLFYILCYSHTAFWTRTELEKNLRLILESTSKSSFFSP